MQLIQRNQFRGSARSRSSGFTLLEVMVALFVTAIGLLGIAKIQALAYSSTATASSRSLVAIQASGLAASMHANRNYWSTGSAPATITITTTTAGTTVTVSILPAMNVTANCSGTACINSDLAAYDLQTWATALGALVPNSTTTITCPTTIPVNCVIQVTWSEKAVSVNTQGVVNSTSTIFTPTYTLFVEP
jgi:type IV pilus assembly protein PilV